VSEFLSWRRTFKRLCSIYLAVSLVYLPPATAFNSITGSTLRIPAFSIAFEIAAIVPSPEAARGFALLPGSARTQRAAAWNSGQHHGFGIPMREASAELEENIHRRMTAFEIDVETEGKIEGYSAETVLIAGKPVTLFVHPTARERLHRRSGKEQSAQKFINFTLEARRLHGEPDLAENVYRNLHSYAPTNSAKPQKYLIVDWLEEAPALYGNCSQESYFYIHASAPVWMDAIGAGHELEHIAGAGTTADEEELLARIDRILIEAIGGIQQLRDTLGDAVKAEDSVLFQKMRLDRSEVGLMFGPAILHDQYDPFHEHGMPNLTHYMFDPVKFAENKWQRFQIAYNRVFRALVFSDTGNSQAVKDIMAALSEVYVWWKEGAASHPVERSEAMRLGGAADMSKRVALALQKLESTDAVAAGILIAILLPEAMTPVAISSELQLHDWVLSEYSSRFRAAAEEEVRKRDSAEIRPILKYFDPWAIFSIYRQRDERPADFIQRTMNPSARRWELGVLGENAEFRYLLWRRRAENMPGDIASDSLAAQTLEWALAAFRRGNHDLPGSPQMREAYEEAEQYFRILLIQGDLEDIALENLYRLEWNRVLANFEGLDAEDLPEQKENPYTPFARVLPAAYYQADPESDFMPPLDIPREQIPMPPAISSLQDMPGREAFPHFQKLITIFSLFAGQGKLGDDLGYPVRDLGDPNFYRNVDGDLQPSALLTQAVDILFQLAYLPFPGVREVAHDAIMRLKAARIEMRWNDRGYPTYERPQTYTVTIAPGAHTSARPAKGKPFPPDSILINSDVNH
jgi:hypothetical protein